MKLKVLLTLLFSGFLSISSAQQSDLWVKWSWLIGEWRGEGTGQPGQGGGTFSFRSDLDGKILVRKSHSEYPATENKQAVTHDDLMIIYPDQSGSPASAIYFDNEGHKISYSISYAARSIILISEKVQGSPVFRLTYTLLDNNSVNTKFEMSQDGVNYTVYIEGKSKRMN